VNRQNAYTTRLVAVMVFFALAVFAAPAWSETAPALVDLKVKTGGRYVTVDARLENGLNNKVQEAIASGMPITFAYRIELRKEGALWGDKLVRVSEVAHTVQYDSLKKVYRFSAQGDVEERKVITHKKESYQELMETLSAVPIVPVYSLDPKASYYVRIRADLKTDEKLSPSPGSLLFFVPFNDFKTSWTESPAIALDTAAASGNEGLAAKSDEGEDEGNPEVLKHVIRSFNK